MPEIVRCRFDHSGRGPSSSTELTSPVGQLEAWQVSDVVAVVAEAEAAAHRGWHAAGFVAYEAAPAFDTALPVRTGDASPSAAHLPLAWFGLFADARPVEALPQFDLGPTTVGRPSSAWSCEIGVTEHAAGVEAIRTAIAEGETYLVNFTTRFRRAWESGEDAFGLYQRLVAGHAGGFHAFIETSDWAVACGSPELFFESDAGRLITRPMKGTAPRGRWSDEDLQRAEGLRLSPKERAENLMVVDLLRNDLGRIATTGTVSVPVLWQVERHPTVWQLTSTVTADIRPGLGLVDIFGALFPCGSVTGAPKVSTMALIADLEHSPRGVYCGAVGVIQPERPDCSAVRGGVAAVRGGVAARFAVAIRTAVVDKTRQVAEYGSGGGITWDSTAALEWDEVLVKTRALADPTPLADPNGVLFETMGFHPHRSGDPEGGVGNLRAHLARLTSSADQLGLPPPRGAEQAIADAVADQLFPARVRLVLHLDGTVQVETSPLLVEEHEERIQQLCIDPEPVDSRDVMLFHKTTDRRRYIERALRHAPADDVVLVNQRGEATETTRANLAVLVDGQWWTPPLDSGLLPGVERARLLATGHLIERVVTAEQLRKADGVATVSSLRGWRSASVCLQCLC